MNFSFLDFFTDPLLFPSTIGSMLMCLSSSIVGVIVFVRKRVLVGEALSHAAYPGVVLSVFVGSMLFPFSESFIAYFVLVGAFIFAIGALFFIGWMEKKLKSPSDAALCFVLSSFLGIGILFASRIQMTHPLWYRQIQAFLYGQAATMTAQHVMIYSVLAFAALLFITLLYHPIKSLYFDPIYSRSIGIKKNIVGGCCLLLTVLAVVIGIRSVGIVLMSGMLIAPAAAARQLTNRFSSMFVLAGFIGLLSGFLGNFLSVKWGKGLPTGPMIMLVSVAFCVLALLFGWRRGIVIRYFRVVRFKYHCKLENALKMLWKKRKLKNAPLLTAHLIMRKFAEKREGTLTLTEKGKQKALQIIRHHRLWEVYLHEIGFDAGDLHRIAEEMEHVITPEMEQLLTKVLEDPSQDPHKQPIPKPI